MFTGFEARILLNANVVRTFTHDGAGNITQDVRAGSGTYNYTMNQRNRLATARVGTTQVGSYGTHPAKAALC